MTDIESANRRYAAQLGSIASERIADNGQGVVFALNRIASALEKMADPQLRAKLARRAAADAAVSAWKISAAKSLNAALVPTTASERRALRTVMETLANMSLSSPPVVDMEMTVDGIKSVLFLSSTTKTRIAEMLSRKNGEATQ